MPSKDEVLRMYAEGKITARQGAEMLGMTLAEFYELWEKSGLKLGEEWQRSVEEELGLTAPRGPEIFRVSVKGWEAGADWDLWCPGWDEKTFMEKAKEAVVKAFEELLRKPPYRPFKSYIGAYEVAKKAVEILEGMGCRLIEPPTLALEDKIYWSPDDVPDFVPRELAEKVAEYNAEAKSEHEQRMKKLLGEEE